MAGVKKSKVTFQFPFLSSLKKFAVDKALGASVGDIIVNESRKLISIGTSPVAKVRRFKGYAIDRKGKGYPDTSYIKNKFPTKQKRPVNLSLNDWYLDHIRWWFDKKSLVVVGLSRSFRKFTRPSDKINDFYETHNMGKHPHVPMRKHLPTKRREEFKPIIMKRVRDFVEKEMLKKIIVKQNKASKR